MDESENIDVEDNEEEYVEAPKKKRKGEIRSIAKINSID